MAGALVARFPRPCVKCRQLFVAASDYCDACRPQKIEGGSTRKPDSAERKNKKALLYNSTYRARAKVLRATATHCHICKQAFTNRKLIEADHLVPGNPLSPLAPAHRSCNIKKSNKYIG